VKIAKKLDTRCFNPSVDAYIEKSKTFAQPILRHLRELVHEACPGVVETVKWSRPFFEFNGVILGNMSAFKEHCSFGFWGAEMGAALREAKVLRSEAMGSLGRITKIEDLPPNNRLLSLMKKAARLIERGEYTSPMAARVRVVKAPKSELKMPAEFARALKANKKAAASFAALSPSCRREYVEWIADAKRKETREKRIETALEWIGEGKQRHWKYQKG